MHALYYIILMSVNQYDIWNSIYLHNLKSVCVCVYCVRCIIYVFISKIWVSSMFVFINVSSFFLFDIDSKMINTRIFSQSLIYYH